MPIRVVESRRNARVKELRKALLQPGRDARSPIGIEGPKMVEEAVRAGLHVATVFVAQDAERVIESLRLPPGTEILQVSRALLDSALATETPQPVAALIEPPRWTWESILNRNQKKALVVVLAGIQDPGNLGTILRSAEAFGATGIVSLPATVSAWNPKAVRASAGSVFRVPLAAASEKICFEHLREAGVKILATTVRGAQSPDRVSMAGAVALIIGNEGSGLAEDLIAKTDAKITIPCPGPVESLNAAMAATVLLYEAARQRATASSGPAAHPIMQAAARSAR
jgi:RNA methyltransferase, TrmH family